MTDINHFVDGAVSALNSTRRSDVHNPATGQVTGQVALADALLNPEASDSVSTVIERSPIEGIVADVRWKFPFPSEYGPRSSQSMV